MLPENRVKSNISISATSVSFVTACRNRLQHLRLTLPENIRGNASDKFVILDYNSSDGLKEWVLSEMSAHLMSGRLFYYLESTAKYFYPSHARNVAMLLGDDIVCNVDADNYIGVGFGDHLRSIFASNDEKVIVVRPRSAPLDCSGRIAMYRSEFVKLGGYYEGFDSTYGCEDYDLVARAKLNGYKVVRFGSDFIGYISHSDDLRISNLENKATVRHKNLGKLVNSHQWGVACVTDLDTEFVVSDTEVTQFI